MVNSNDPERDVDAEYRELCSVVGHLFMAFSRLEGALAALLKLHLGDKLPKDSHVQQTLPSAVYGSMRFKAARDTLKRVMGVERTPDATRKFVSGVFEQIASIESLRDMLAHQQTVPADEGWPFWQITDLMSTRDIPNTKIYIITPSDISKAADDLVNVGLRLGSNSALKGIFTGDGFDISPIPWLYKPSMLKLLHQHKGRLPLGRARPPKA